MATATATAPRSDAVDTVFSPDAGVREAAAAVARFLSGRRGEPMVLRTAGGSEVELPPFLADLLNRLVTLLARGQAIRLRPYRTAMTTTEAAELLGMSRTHLIHLIDRGEIPAFKVGAHHRLDVADVAAFRHRQRAEFQEAMREIADSGDDWPND